MDDDETFNAEQYDLMRQIIYSSSSHFDASRVRTWTEIKDCYDQDIEKFDDETVNMKASQLKEDLKNKLGKVEFDIADIKYPFLSKIRENSIDESFILHSIGFNFVFYFECNLSEEEYENIKMMDKIYRVGKFSKIILKCILGFSAFSPIMYLLGPLIDLGMLFLTKEMMQNKLKELDSNRNKLREELENCQSTIEKQKEMLEEKKKTIIRLEATLVSQIQIQQQQN